MVRDRLLAIAAPGPADACVDLGAGTGFVALALAPLAGSVLAVDISPVMADSLAARAAQAGLRNVRTAVADLRTFRLPAASVDLVVSSYALHHLRDKDKRALAAEAARWLRPGGRIVVADMMFGRGATQRDREILREKVQTFARQGPCRLVADRQEPCQVRAWRRPRAPGRTAFLAAGAARCRLHRRALRAGRRGSRHRLRNPPQVIAGPRQSAQGGARRYRACAVPAAARGNRSRPPLAAVGVDDERLVTVESVDQREARLSGHRQGGGQRVREAEVGSGHAGRGGACGRPPRARVDEVLAPLVGSRGGDRPGQLDDLSQAERRDEGRRCRS